MCGMLEMSNSIELLTVLYLHNEEHTNTLKCIMTQLGWMKKKGNKIEMLSAFTEDYS